MNRVDESEGLIRLGLLVTGLLTGLISGFMNPAVNHHWDQSEMAGYLQWGSFIVALALIFMAYWPRRLTRRK